MQPEDSLPYRFDIEEISTLAGLESIEGEWSALWERCSNATPFQTPEWLIPWWKHIGEGVLWTLVFRDNGRMVGVVPLFIYETGIPPSKKLMLLGSGNSDVLAALFETGFERMGSSALFSYLTHFYDRWDVFEIQQLREDSILLKAPVPPTWYDDTAQQDVCPLLDLSDSGSESDCIPKGFLKRLHYYRRRSRRIGSVRLEYATPNTVLDMLDTLIQLHKARWSERNEEGVLAENSIQRFHKEVAPVLLTRGLLRMYGYYLNDKPLAVFYGLQHKGIMFYYLSGYDPEYDWLSPGNQIVHYAILEALREGNHTFDFLRGAEDYKYRWGAADRPSYIRRLRHSARSD